MGWGGRLTMLRWLVVKASNPLSSMHMLTPLFDGPGNPVVDMHGIKECLTPLWCAYICGGKRQPFYTLVSCKAAPLSLILIVPQLVSVVLCSGCRNAAALVTPYACIPAEGSCFRSSDKRDNSRGWENGRYNPSCRNLHQRSSPTSSRHCDRW
jgi:hypothetical protein